MGSDAPAAHQRLAEVDQWARGAQDVLEASAAVAQGLRRARLAPSSRATYTTGQRVWREFCERSGIQVLLPESLPVGDVAAIVDRFVGYIMVTRRVTSASTVNTYLSAVSALHVDAGLRSPTRAVRRAGLMQDLTQGLQRVAGSAQQSPPVTVGELGPVVEQAFASQDELSVACAALCVLAATAMLRVHEYVVLGGQRLVSSGLGDLALSDDPRDAAAARESELVWRARQALRSQDVTFSREGGAAVMSVQQRAWKYSLPGTVHTIPIRCNGNDWRVCAHCCVWRFMQMRQQVCGARGLRLPPWLGQLAGGRFVSERDITDFVRRAVRATGRPDWASCTPHSLRRGAATSLYHATKDVSLVREVGRWRSATGVDPYLRTHASTYHDGWMLALQRARESQGTALQVMGTTAQQRKPARMRGEG